MPTIADMLTLAARHHEAGNLEAVDQLCRQVLEADREQPDALHRLGLVATQTGRHQLAAEYIEQAVARRPDLAACHINLGLVYQKLHKPAKAEACFRRAISLRPTLAETHNHLAISLADQGKTDEAVASFHEALRRRPNFVNALVNLANVLVLQDKLDEALAWNRRALQIQPQSVTAHNGIGMTLAARGNLQSAMESFRTALLLKPDDVDAHVNLGNAQAALGFLDEAVGSYREALRLQPDCAEASNRLGIVLADQGKHEEAEECYRAILRLLPESASGFNNLGLALLVQGRFDEGVAALRTAAQLRPDNPGTLNNLGTALANHGFLDEGVECFREALRIKSRYPEAHSNLLLTLNYCPKTSAAELFAEHRSWAALHMPGPDESPHANLRDPERRLRVGYVSPDFRFHPVAYFLGPILAHHDRRRVESFCYAEVPHQDAVTNNMQALASAWRYSCGLKDAQLAEQVRRDDIDILVDLCGHTSNNRLGLFARKPAPLQVAYLGYPNTTGLKTMDYFLTDDVADPPEEPSYYTESLVRLPNGFCCYRAPDDAPPCGPLPALRNGYITFGSLHGLAKVNDTVLDLWSAILRAVPASRMLICRQAVTGSAGDRLRRLFAERGIEEERLDLRHEGAGKLKHWKVYQEIDITLDTFPWSGHTTACESLWMGVPVVTLRGNRHAGRMVASVLTRLGLNDWIVESTEQYLALAVARAYDPERLRGLRGSLRELMGISPLCDAPRFTRELEDAFRTMWRAWCASEPRP